MDLYLKINSFLRVVLLLIGFFVLQSSIIPVSASPIIFGQEHHSGISENYAYDEIESSVWVESGRSGGVNWGFSKDKVGSECEVLLSVESSAAKGVPKYLYHYTSKGAAQSISKSGLRVGKDEFSYLTNTKSLSPLQAQIELALPANRALPNSLLRINTSGLSPAAIRRVQGNLPGLGAGGGTEFLFNQTIPSSAIKIIR